MSNETSKTPPTHRVYAVSQNGSNKPTWTEIGAAWPNKDGKGFNLTFNARPLEGAQIVLRVIAAKKETAKPSRRTAGRYSELNTAAAQ